MNYLNRRQFIRYTAFGLSTSFLAGCAKPSSSPIPSPTTGLIPVTFGIDWLAEAEYGGFYQALATGLYEEYGLDVTLKPGGPRVNVTQLLMSGLLDFCIGATPTALSAVESEIPKITVAAFFQKCPRVLLAHPNVGHDTLESLKGNPIYVTGSSTQGFWPFLKEKYGFTNDQRRPYNFNVAPFLQDQNSAQQGLFSSEPYTIQQEGGFTPVEFLLADYGYNPYYITIEARQDFVQMNPEVVQAFVDASIKGWYRYLEDPAPANELILKDNPEMTIELLDYGVEKIKEYGIVESGDAETMGIGAMTDERWQQFFETQASVGIYQTDTDYRQAYTLEFVNQGS